MRASWPTPAQPARTPRAVPCPSPAAARPTAAPSCSELRASEAAATQSPSKASWSPPSPTLGRRSSGRRGRERGGGRGRAPSGGSPGGRVGPWPANGSVEAGRRAGTAALRRTVPGRGRGSGERGARRSAHEPACAHRQRPRRDHQLRGKRALLGHRVAADEVPDVEPDRPELEDAPLGGLEVVMPDHALVPSRGPTHSAGCGGRRSRHRARGDLRSRTVIPSLTRSSRPPTAAAAPIPHRHVEVDSVSDDGPIGPEPPVVGEVRQPESGPQPGRGSVGEGRHREEERPGTPATTPTSPIPGRGPSSRSFGERDRHLVEHRVHDALRGRAAQRAVEVEQDPVIEDRVGAGADVIGQRVVPPLDRGPRLAR